MRSRSPTASASPDPVGSASPRFLRRLSGSGTGGKSNWSAKFTDGDESNNYVADDDDNLDNNKTYTENFVDFKTSTSRSEKWTASAAFDTRGTDNHCTSSTIF